MLLHELQKGSSEAFKTLVREYSKRVIGTCYSFVNSKDDAEDLAQEVFIEIFRSIARFREESQLDTWIYRICVNKSLDFLRKQRRKKQFAELKHLLHLRKAVPQTAHQEVEEEERKQILRDQIALLPENQRIALVLSQYDKMSNKKIGEIMSVSESAVESLLSRARSNLRRKLEKYFEKNV